jgi:hypothetical protein
MKYSELATYVRDKTGTDSVTLTDAIMTIYFNLAKDEICRAISRADETYFGITMLHNLVAGQREYAFEDNMLTNMFRLEANIAPTTDEEDWKILKEYDIQQFKTTTDEDSLTSYMSGKDNGFIIFGNEIKIVSADPIIDVTDGMKLWCNIYPTDIESTDLASGDDMSEPPSATEYGIPKQFHHLLANRIIIEYKESLDKPIALTQKEQNWYQELQMAVSQLSPQNFDREYMSSQPYNDGSQY